MPCEELDPPLRNTFKEAVSKNVIKLNCLKANRERGIFKILPTDVTRACKHISLDKRQLGLVREEGQIVDHGNMKERVGKTYTLSLSLWIFYAGLLLAPAEDFYPLYIL